MSQDDDSGGWRTLGLELIGEARPLPALGYGALTNSLTPAQAGARVSTSKPTDALLFPGQDAKPLHQPGVVTDAIALHLHHGLAKG